MTLRNETLSNDLYMSLSSHSALPYLFLGSGITRRYLDLPDWEGLLRMFADASEEDFNYHLASAGGDLPTTATSIGHVFHERWWKDEQYEEQRAEYASSIRDELGGLKVAAASYIQQNDKLAPGVPGVDKPELCQEISTLKSAVVDGVITTNYDSFTDYIFPQFSAYVGQEELLMSDAQFIAETYKIHGTATQPLSLVLTSNDYRHFSERNHYLAAKLLTIFAEHPVIFAGYSLGDNYVNEILDNIATAVGPERLDELGKRIYFVEWNPDPSSEASVEATSIERGGARFPITRIETYSFQWIWDALTRLERPFPAGVLRELRKHVFDLVTNPHPGDTRETVRAIPIDAEGADDVRVVFGVGHFSETDLEEISSISARTLTREDLELDLLGLRKRPLDPENVLRHGIPDQIRPTITALLPVYKYLHEAGLIGPEGEVAWQDLKPIIRQLAEREIANHSDGVVGRFRREVEGKLNSPRQIMDSDLPLYFKLESLLLLNPDQYDIDELGEVLASLYPKVGRNSKSNLRKVLVHYDRLKFSAAPDRV